MDIYLDHNATTPLDEAVLEAMLPFLRNSFGNASSSHSRGRQAASAVGRAREQVGELLGVSPTRVVWTSGATEALNTALKGLAELREGRSTLVVAATDHKAVLDVAEWLGASRCVNVLVAPVDSDGVVDLDFLGSMVTKEAFAVAVMAANNETGVLAPVEILRELARSVGAAFVCDTTQAVGKIALGVADVDVATLSAHKLYGPQGVGAMVLPKARGHRFEALLHGGGHERGYRSGTLNVAGIVGCGAAAVLARERLTVDAPRTGQRRDRLERKLMEQVGGVSVHGGKVARLPNTSSVHIAGVDADALIINTPDVAFSSGSACTAAVPTPSHVLTAMGVAPDVAEQSVRLSVGRSTTDAQIDRAVELLAVFVGRLRALDGAA